MMRTSAHGKALVEKFEGRRYEAYQDERGIWTIGVGHTGHEVHAGLVWTDQQIDDALARDLSMAEFIVSNNVRVPLTQSMFDALVSFAFNIGPGGRGIKDGFVVLKSGQPSTILRKLNAGDYAGARDEFPKWNHAGDHVSDGLTKRRADEARLFLAEGLPPGAAESRAAAIAAAAAAAMSPTPTAPPAAAEQSTTIEHQEPAPIVESKPTTTKEPKTMDPLILSAAIQAISTFWPALRDKFITPGSSEVAQRNVAAAEAIVGAAVKSLDAPNAQAMIEQIRTDPAAAMTVKTTLASMFPTIDIAGVGDARAYSLQAAAIPPWRQPTFLLTIPLVIIVGMTMYAMLFDNDVPVSAETRATIIGLVIGALVGAWTGFWFGTTAQSARKDELIAGTPGK